MKVLSLLAIVTLLSSSFSSETKIPALQFDSLPYAFNALEPYIDAKTMEIHYTKHHRGYFDNLVKALMAESLSVSGLPKLFGYTSKLSPAVRNNAGGHFNHTLFWSIMAPKAGGKPEGTLGERITATFGSFDTFKEQFKKAALTRFGSGWAWLCVADDGSLFITSTTNQDNPLMDVAEKRGTPILGLDVWEHAYYLKYQNQRGGYIDAFWNVVNWPEVSKRFTSLTNQSKKAPEKK